VVDRQLARGMTRAELRTSFIRGEEFRSKHAPPPMPGLPIAPSPLEVDVAADDAQRVAMLDRTGRYWARIGGEAPHWSVLTQDRYRPERIAETRGTFYETGRLDRELVRDMLARHGMRPADLPRLVEFGCGVGRATLALAQDFAEVIGCDISPTHLALARRAAAEAKRGNVQWVRSTVERPMPGGRRR
jgi:SAM-dependent methyltransferase